LEERQNFDIAELSNIKVRYPKVFAVFPRNFHVFVRFVDLTVDKDPHILPVHIEEHVQRNLLKIMHDFTISWTGTVVTCSTSTTVNYAPQVTTEQNTQTCFQYSVVSVPLIFCFVVANGRLAIWVAVKYATMRPQE